jgi:hypothetical protein
VADVGWAQLAGRGLLVGGLVLRAAEGLVLGLPARPFLEVLGRVLLEGLDLLPGLFLLLVGALPLLLGLLALALLVLARDVGGAALLAHRSSSFAFGDCVPGPARP